MIDPKIFSAAILAAKADPKNRKAADLAGASLVGLARLTCHRHMIGERDQRYDDLVQIISSHLWAIHQSPREIHNLWSYFYSAATRKLLDALKCDSRYHRRWADLTEDGSAGCEDDTIDLLDAVSSISQEHGHTWTHVPAHASAEVGK